MPPELVQGFYLKADGKTFGPFRSSQEEKIKGLLHLKGIEVSYGLFPPGDLKPAPKKRKAKQENLSLLDGLDFRPISKREAI